MRATALSALRGTHVRGIVAASAAALFAYHVLTRMPPSYPVRIEALVVATGLIAVVIRHPVTATASVLVYVPLQTPFLAMLWTAGLPAAFCRELGFVKEAVVLGVLLAGLGVGTRAGRRRPLARPEKLIVAFLVLVGVYFVAPALVPGALGDQGTFVRVAAARINVLFLVLFLGLALLRPTARDVRRVENAMLVCAAVMVAGGLWELFDVGGYDDVITNKIRTIQFITEVQNASFHPGDALEKGSVGSHVFTRNGSFILDAVVLGFYLVTPLAIAVRRLVSEGFSWRIALLTGGIGLVLLDTITRAAVLAGAIAVLVLLGAGLRRRDRGSVFVAGLLVAGLLVSAPFVGTTDIGRKFAGISNGQDESSTQHSERTGSAFALALRTPLGLGLGANPGTGAQQHSSNSVTAEDAYLQVSLELGWLALIIFVAILATLLREVARFSQVGRGPPTAVLAAGLGLAVGGLFLHVWIDFPTSLTFWGYAGVVYGWCRTAAELDAEPGAGPDADGAAPPDRRGARPVGRVAVAAGR